MMVNPPGFLKTNEISEKVNMIRKPNKKAKLKPFKEKSLFKRLESEKYRKINREKKRNG